MAYVDGTVCDQFNVPRVKPPLRFWTYELLKERETEEIDAGGLGMSELQGPYIEEDIDPIPEDEEVIWDSWYILVLYLVCIFFSF